jgi:hypothetical protein
MFYTHNVSSIYTVHCSNNNKYYYYYKVNSDLFVNVTNLNNHQILCHRQTAFWILTALSILTALWKLTALWIQTALSILTALWKLTALWIQTALSILTPSPQLAMPLTTDHTDIDRKLNDIRWPTKMYCHLTAIRFPSDNACPVQNLCTNSSNECSGRSVGKTANY